MPGSLVRIVNTGANYSTYQSFLMDKGFEDLLGRYNGMCPLGQIGTLLHESNHTMFKNTPVCIVEVDNDAKTIVIIGEYGLEVVDAAALDTEIEVSEISISDLFGI